MGTLFLVRHGQASFGADDYDRLSDLGRRQCVRLGEWFSAKGIVFEAALVGTLRRQSESLQAIDTGMRVEPTIHAVHPEPLPRPTNAEEVRGHFRLLRVGLARWMAGASRPQGMPTYAEFAAGVAGALEHVRTRHAGNVLLVSSGGPISTAVGLVLGMAPEATIELNLRIRNSAVTEFTFNPKRHHLLSYNSLPHLDAPEHAHWVTYT
jgi:broad specificity phosphatase PhoE